MWRIYKALINDGGLWLAFILAISCYLIASGGQIGMTLDSYYYFSAAENWAKSGQLLDHQGNVYANWPPLYPWLLSLGVPNMLSFALWLHGFALLASVYFFNRCLPEKLSPAIRNAALLSYALYAPLLACSIYLWSEVVFMAVLMAAFAAFQRKEKPAMLVAYIIAANLMCLQRNAGIFFIAAWTLSHLFTAQPLQLKIRTIAIQGSLASMTFIAWQLRNFLWVTQAQDFRQNIALVSLPESIRLSLSAMSTWLLPLQLPESFRLGLFLLAIIALTLAAIHSRNRLQMNISLLLTIGCYLAGTWALRMNIPSENDRYFLPLFPFFLLLIINILHQYNKIIIPLLLSICIYQTARGVKNTYQWHQRTAASSAFNDFKSRNAPIFLALQQN